MTEGKRCPACGEDIGVWAVFAAGLPNRIWCPHCRTRLRYRASLDLLVIAVLAIAVVLLTSFSLANFLAPLRLHDPGLLRPAARDNRVWTMIFLGVALAVAVPMELAFAWYLRSMKRLELFRPLPPSRPGKETPK